MPSDQAATPPLFARRAALIEAEVDGELVALHVDSGTCYGFNLTATRIWRFLDQPRTRAALLGSLLAEFDVDPVGCARDLDELLDQLATDGLIDTMILPDPVR